MSTTEQLHIYLFGSFRLVRNGTAISSKDWHTRQARQLFKVLLQEHPRLISARRLIALLWPEDAENAHKALRSAVSALRDVLEPGREPWLSSSFVPRGQGGYALAFPPACSIFIDANEFERLLDLALRGTNTHEKRALLARALQLYAGDYLAEDGEAPWALPERARLRERYFAGVTRLMQWQGELAHYDEAIELGRHALGQDACREPLYRLIMQFQALAGDNAAALQTFEQCRQMLADSLGAAPSPQTLGLHMALLNGTFLAPARSAFVESEIERFAARAERFGESQTLERRLLEAQERALRYSMQAADYARRAYSYHQALADYDAASRLLQVQEARRDRVEALSSEWWGQLYHGRGLVYEALQDWQGQQENYSELSAWAARKQDTLLAKSSFQRLIVNRSLMGHLSEALSMGREFMCQLQRESVNLPAQNVRTRECLRLLTDLTGRWERLLNLDEPEDSYQESTAPFPLFSPAPTPSVRDWKQASDLLGSSLGAFVLTSYGWALLLQGLSADAENCLCVARQAAESTGQVTSEILARLHLSQLYYRSEQHERGMREFALCMERCQQAREASWAMVWPLLNQAYYLLDQGKLDEVEYIFRRVERQLENQDLPAYRYSLQIGQGLLALARQQVERARSLLRETLAQKQSVYIEVYVLAELGLARIAEQQGAHAEARERIRRMLAFTARRSLLQLYALSALSLARLSLRTRETQGMTNLLAGVLPLLIAAGARGLAGQCRALQAQFSL